MTQYSLEIAAQWLLALMILLAARAAYGIGRHRNMFYCVLTMFVVTVLAWGGFFLLWRSPVMQLTQTGFFEATFPLLNLLFIMPIATLFGAVQGHRKGPRV